MPDHRKEVIQTRSVETTADTLPIDWFSATTEVHAYSQPRASMERGQLGYARFLPFPPFVHFRVPLVVTAP